MNMKKLILTNLPYLLFVYPFDKAAQAFRLAPGADLSAKLLSIGDGFTAAFSSPGLSFALTDLLIGIAGAVILRLAVYMKGKNAKKYRHGMEYGSARWGTPADIAPFMDKDFFNNIPMTQTERITMASRPKQPKYARNKNILVIGGSGSGKTRFFAKPSLLQCHSSYVVTDPKGTILNEVGKLLERKKYRIKCLNLINFKKSMRYNPLAYIRSEKDILKLVNALIMNTKGEGEKSSEDFWVKAERLYYSALIGYIWYEAPEEERNFITLLDLINASEEMYIVRYADDFKIFCRDYVTAKKVMCATKLWLAENLHLQTSDEKSGITNLQKNYTTFLGIKFKVVTKGSKWIIRSHMADKSKVKVIQKLRNVWRDIKNPSKQSEIDKNISLYNAMVMGMHNYYCMATMVSADFAEIAFKVTGKSNGMNHNNRCIPIERQGEINSKFIQEKYGKSKQFRWIRGRMIIPVGYVSYEYPKYKRREVNKYVRKYSDVENCISYDVMKHMMENAHLYPTLEMADNALSRYIAQKGKCAITHEALTITDMVCEHIKPCKGERNDTYRNLIILSKDVSELVGVANETKIKKLLKDLPMTEEMQNKINKLRKHRELEEIQFEDYTGTKK